MTSLIPRNQYIHKRDKDVVLFVGYGVDKQPIFQNIFNSFLYKGEADYYIPYSPPVVHKRYLQWYCPIAQPYLVSCTASSIPWDKNSYPSFELLSETVVTYTKEKEDV